MLSPRHSRSFRVMAAPRFLSASHSVRDSDLSTLYTRVPFSSVSQDKSDSSFSLFGASSSSPNVVVSPTGIIHVLGYTPTEGERGVPITVRIHFRPDLAEPIYVRLLVGHKPVATKVRELSGAVYGRWQLDAAAPPYEDDKSSTKVLLSVQALNDENNVVDTVTFGEFSYWAPSRSPHAHERSGQASSGAPPNALALERKTPSLRVDTIAGLNQRPYLRRRLTSQIPNRSPTTPDRTTSPKPVQQVRLHRRMKTQSLMRTKFSSAGELGEELYAQTPILDLVTPLNSICHGWTQAEFQAGRRLVRFGKVQDGRRLIVSCEPISQEEYCEQDSVISCIYREESATCFVTSVDVIYLLERLTNGEFPVEEKNRIRRNLEGLRPTTVSKHKPGYEDFFQRIMEFPDPKPRNIEKDLKVFKWNLLGQALEKILSKYSIYTTSVTESVPPSTPLSESSDPMTQRLPYSPSGSLEQAYIDTSATTKRGSVSDDQFNSSEESDAHVSAIEGTPASTHLTYPLYDSDIHVTRTTEQDVQEAWCADYKSGEMVTYDNYGGLAYDIVEPISTGNYPDGAGYDFSTYEGLSFSELSDQALNGMSECYI
ncbi:hypothetical protein AMATHDRAFT_2478 [Amanita thiersii Skay4041]|uniref:DUF7082 domain-containing protein n=1 Tax=Amanita thiersii Skay4041 TaxID=703135 RepID=A0A2A9NN72_9AGAR|nr:hypothetical protein AMATHDRAFT_2478 [Amanita thiersii Skay4041]